jgi:hypothetical protein
MKDDYLFREFKIDQRVIENIVLYLYRQRLHRNPVYA